MTLRITVTPDMIDNRDLSETWLNLPNGQVVEVNPIDLAINALENAHEQMDYHELIELLKRLK